MDKVFEAYVPFKIAQMLKDKGFDDMFYECTRWYNIDNEELFPSPVGRYKGCLPAPTLQVALKWLRDKHIHIRIKESIDEDYTYEVYCYHSRLGKGYWYNSRMSYRTYEFAVEDAIRYCLERLDDFYVKENEKE